MQCPQCRHENREQARFCESCGTRLASKCAQCGSELGPTARFCSECGTPVAAPTPTTLPPAPHSDSRFTSPQSYTPQHLAERIISSRGALEGERKQVTVLFADLKGSMELLADRDPEEARRILDPVLERMMEAVHRYEGTVNQVMGDGIMALFGAPIAHEDHAVRACYAALRMQEAVNHYADEVRRTEGVLIQIRVGLNSGEVVVRSIGSDLQMDYTAVGQTTHLAARMEQVATPGAILLAPNTLHLAEGYVQVRSLGPMAVKGLSEPVEVYELGGAGTARSRLQAAAARGLTKFVGRDAELETLRRTLDQAGSGHGQIVALVGEPGVGKSRLVWEFSHSHRTQGWLVLESGSVSYGKATSYLPVIDLLKNYCGIESQDDHRRMRQKVLGKMLDLERALEIAVPPLLALLDVPVENPGWEALDPPQRRQRTLDACKRLLLRESQEQALLLVFEDLHWIDAETQALLDTLVDSLPTARILLLVNYRPEYEHAWHRKTYFQQLRLDPLPPENAEELLGALLGDAAELQTLKRVLIERTEGNPFFVEESVRTLVEGGALVGERGAYRLAKPFESAQVPATVQAVLAARIDRLAPEDKRLLQAAAVIGTDVPYALLHAVAELPEDSLRQGLVQLQAGEFLYETSLFPDLEYTFKHALTHEVAYGSLLQERRRTLHARIVEAIEQVYPERLEDHIERLAHHAVRAEVWPKAVSYLQQAGTKAMARSAYQEAVGYFQQALTALERLPEGRETREQALAVRLALGPVLIATRSMGNAEVGETYAQALALCQELGETTRLFPTLWGLWAFHTGTGDAQTARGVGQQLVALAERLEDDALVLQAHHALWTNLVVLGELTATRVHFAEGLRRYDAGLHHAQAALYGGHDPGVCCRAQAGRALWLLGYPDQARQHAEDAVALARDLAHPHSLAIALQFAIWVYRFVGETQAAARYVPALQALASEHAFVEAQQYARFVEGQLLFEQGATAAGIALMRQHLDAGLGFRSVHVGLLVESYLKMGQTDDGWALLEPALEVSQRRARFNEAELLRLKGELVQQQEHPVAAAEGSFRAAMAVARRQAARSLELRAATSLARLWQQQGKQAEARQVLADIYGWFTEGLDTRDLQAAHTLLAELS
jgi:predicted ATPase/class 3 adenylate cyclase